LKQREEMNLLINGETKSFNENITLQEVLKELSLEGKVMAAAVNMNIVKQDNWKSYKLSDGDKLELLDFVGGG
jgi:sulfur carrier protein